MIYQIQITPIRFVSDIVGNAENYSIPDFKDLSNRITNNLLYYQTNYFLFFLTKFLLIR